MSRFRRVPTVDPPPAAVLTPDELERADRYRWAYAFTAMPDGFTTIREAERVIDRLRFVQWRMARDYARAQLRKALGEP